MTMTTTTTTEHVANHHSFLLTRKCRARPRRAWASPPRGSRPGWWRWRSRSGWAASRAGRSTSASCPRPLSTPVAGNEEWVLGYFDYDYRTLPGIFLHNSLQLRFTFKISLGMVAELWVHYYCPCKDILQQRNFQEDKQQIPWMSDFCPQLPQRSENRRNIVKCSIEHNKPGR